MSDLQHHANTAKGYLYLIGLFVFLSFAGPYIFQGAESICGGRVNQDCPRTAYEQLSYTLRKQMFDLSTEGRRQKAENIDRYSGFLQRSQKLGVDTQKATGYISSGQAVTLRAKQMGVPVNFDDSIPAMFDRMEAATQKGK